MIKNIRGLTLYFHCKIYNFLFEFLIVYSLTKDRSQYWCRGLFVYTLVILHMSLDM